MTGFPEKIMTVSSRPPTPRGKALVVDDDTTNRLVLKGFLSKAGFEVVEAENGRQAIDCYNEEHPDIIFMDIMMPIMDGLESSRQIKSMNNGEFIPIIFLTAMTDSDTITRCIDAGGDDFLTKPVDMIQLQAKIRSMERIRNFHREITELNQKIYHEQKVAEHIFTDVVAKGNANIEHIHTLLRPADLFSGDMLLTAFTPSRDIHILLADFTGHGLSAALGALPASEVFHAMTAKGYSIDEILNSINRKLNNLLPTNMFMAAQYISISNNLKYITVCNCGMPDILLLDRNRSVIKERMSSLGMPLGIIPDFNFSNICEYYDIIYGDRVILSSDGLLEATNINGEQFGEQRFEQSLLAMQRSDNASACFKNVVRIFDTFCHDSPQADDISLVEIPCIPENLPPWDVETILQFYEEKLEVLRSPETAEDSIRDSSEISMLFNAYDLRNVDPVPLIINHINQLINDNVPHQSLFIILSELYINALDHGVLGLDSKLKSNAEGFEKYFSEREQRLSTLDKGCIRITLQIQFHETGGQVNIIFKDSGAGFNYNDYSDSPTDEHSLSGRGISLVRQLCTSVVYFEPGNKVKAIYQWNKHDL